jgi:hypothetical protein
VPFPREKEHQGIQGTFLTFAADVVSRKMILICSSPAPRAAWFHSPWHLKMDLITQNSQNFHTTVLQLLALDHPHINIPNIFTFL